MQTDKQFPTLSINQSMLGIVDHADHTPINQQTLLRDTRGEVLILRRSDGTTYTFCRSHVGSREMKYLAIFWLIVAATPNDAKFFAGTISSNGGRFLAISQNEIIERIGRWVFETLACQGTNKRPARLEGHQ